MGWLIGSPPRPIRRTRYWLLTTDAHKFDSTLPQAHLYIRFICTYIDIASAQYAYIYTYNDIRMYAYACTS